MLLLRNLLLVPLLTMTVACGTTQSTGSLPTPGLDSIEEIVKCPSMPPGLDGVVAVPKFNATEGWPQLAAKYKDYALTEWRKAIGRAKWRNDHPGCPQ